MKRLITFAGLFCAVVSFAQEEPGVEPQFVLEPTSCTACHANGDWFEQDMLDLVESFRDDVHARIGLSCHDCHGGDPNTVLAEDMDAAKENGFDGVPARADIPGTCGKCHSDPTYMRRFRPDVNIDQEREYWTSRHGEALRAGDDKVATCTNCHGVHGIRRIADTESLVFPTRVAQTCGECHSDSAYMEGYSLPTGAALPIDQQAKWQRSVHAQSMFEKEDLTAPTCNDCHGNHGASPPGVESITFVCGQCHGREAEIFRASPKNDGFALHNELLADAGDESCQACHEAPEPQGKISDMHSFSECSSCHGNHGIIRPTIGMLSPPPSTPCAFCHVDPAETGVASLEPAKSVERQVEVQKTLLAEAEAMELGELELFDWLVDKALTLPEHTFATQEETDDGASILHPEFDRLFKKFRIGKSYYTYTDPTTGEATRAPVTRCENCHASEPQMADEPIGYLASREILARMQELTSTTATAERVLLRTRRGGVETRDAKLSIDQAVDAQIGLEVLLHSFELGEGSEFAARHAEGMEHARTALAAGSEALDELAFRRRGLAVSLIVIMVLLVALGLKIRQLSQDPN